MSVRFMVSINYLLKFLVCQRHMWKVFLPKETVWHQANNVNFVNCAHAHCCQKVRFRSLFREKQELKTGMLFIPFWSLYKFSFISKIWFSSTRLHETRDIVNSANKSANHWIRLNLPFWLNTPINTIVHFVEEFCHLIVEDIYSFGTSLIENHVACWK